jgi:competence protein ComEA
MIKRLLLAVLLGFAPIVTSLSAYANDVAVASQAAPVNINKADADTLAQNLVGIGYKRAEAIVRYRDTYGPFFSADDLTEVKGVGQSIVDKNRDRITLE